MDSILVPSTQTLTIKSKSSRVAFNIWSRANILFSYMSSSCLEVLNRSGST